MEKSKKQSSKVQSTKTNRTGKYFYALGRRKSSIAQIRLLPKGHGNININEKPYQEYFPYFALQDIVRCALKEVGLVNKFDVSAKVKGGGKKSQSESIRLGISRALIKFDKDLRKPLKAKGFLTRDSRIKERKKPGLKRARRAPQWSKR